MQAEVTYSVAGYVYVCGVVAFPAQVDASVCCRLEGAQGRCGVPFAGEELQL